MYNPIKESNLKELAAYRRKLWKEPRLRYIFFELTNKCNLTCKHCGSKCTGSNDIFLDEIAVEKTLKSIARECNPSEIMVCITGGEPILHPKLAKYINIAKSMGFAVGMTTNGTLITEAKANELALAGIDNISISIDGLRITHDKFRSQDGCFDKAVEGIKNLKKVGIEPEVITVVHNDNMDELEDIYQLLEHLDIFAWRLVNVDPIGRAKSNDSLFLKSDQLKKLFEFIRDKRFDANNNILVNYGCSHFLTYEYENELRDYYFQCLAGTMTASITAEGNIVACLDIERRPDLVQGNIYKDDFMDIWKGKFEVYREDRTAKSSTCKDCKNREVCMGDSAHTWDYDNNEPNYCVARMLEA